MPPHDALIPPLHSKGEVHSDVDLAVEIDPDDALLAQADDAEPARRLTWEDRAPGWRLALAARLSPLAVDLEYMADGEPCVRAAVEREGFVLYRRR